MVCGAIERLRRPVGRRDAGEVADRAGPGARVESLRIERLAECQRRIVVNPKEGVSPAMVRAAARSTRKGEISETITTSPASAISRAVSAARRVFSTRSMAVKPRSRLSL